MSETDNADRLILLQLDMIAQTNILTRMDVTLREILTSTRAALAQLNNLNMRLRKLEDQIP
jgi:hypothetical protein